MEYKYDCDCNCDYDLKSNLASLCETFLEYVNELFDKGQINEKELEEASKEKIKYLEYVSVDVKI